MLREMEVIMKNKKQKLFWIISVFGITIVSAYPLYMGIRVIYDMVSVGTVLKENYPKYIIPYTPISFAIIICVILLPLFQKYLKRFAVLGASAFSTALFFVFELLFERKVVITSIESEAVAKLEDWQMYLCIVPSIDVSQSIRTEKPIDILIGDYNPAFKLHFYLISVVLILAILNCIYGFAQMIKTGDNSRKKALILQSVSAAGFLGLCILACFTAFWRDGNIEISPISAILMSVFFILLGLTLGIFIGSLLLNKDRKVSVWIPTVISTATTLVMYIGEMILLHGHLYRFGTGFLFNGITGIVFAPVDIMVIFCSGLVMFLLMCGIVKKPLIEENNSSIN